MAMKRVLIANKTYPAAGLELLKNHVNVTIVPNFEWEPNHLSLIKENMKGINALIWNTKHKLTGEILDLAGPELKVISATASGTDHIDKEAVKSRCMLLGNTPKVVDDAVADIAIGLLIAAARRFKEGVADLERGQWKYGVNWTLGQDIANSTVGIIGFGGIGQAIVRRLKGFNVAKFVYCGRNNKPEALTLGVHRVTLEELLKESDFVVVSCPLTAETKHLINRDTLNIMKPNAVLVNIARGEVIDQEALYEALQEKHIFAAGLDVVTPEPLSKDHPLVSLPNCYIIPHMGIATIATRNAMASIAASNILLGLEGKPMKSPVIF